MKFLFLAFHVGVFTAALAASLGGSASAAPTDEIDGAPSSLETAHGECFRYDGVTGICKDDN